MSSNTTTNDTSNQGSLPMTMEEAKRHYLHHPIEKKVYAEIELQLACAENVDRKMLIVTGPPGVGKTTISKMLQKQIIKRELDAMKANQEYLPVVVVGVDESPERKSKWKSLYGNILEAFGDTLIDKKEEPKESGRPQGRLSEKASTNLLRRVVENQIRQRGTKVLIIDECQHLLIEGRYSIKRNLNMLKSLCTKMGIKLVLIGPYELPELINMDGQLIRRSCFIHFRAYDGTEKETKQFMAAVAMIKERLPLKVDPIPDDFMIMHTLRSVGLAKEMLLSAAQRALNLGKSTVTFEDVQISALSPEKLKVIWDEQQRGEGLFVTQQSVADELRQALGLAPLNQAPPKPKGRRSSKVTPGTRSPKHDAIGYGA
jgi:energy-coupling factor transporter ATP-binding protein EcfA2